MLERVHIQNIGIIEDIEIEFDNVLNVLTGETGSGKTLIIDSINLVTGNRVNKDIIRSGELEAFIEVCFSADIPGVSQDGMVILSRRIFSNGKNVCKITGQMATLTQLKQVGDILIDIHGQHDVVNLLDKSKYIELLDNYIGDDITQLKIKYRELLHKRKEIISKQEELSADPIERSRKIDLLQYEIEEISNANLEIGEEEKLIEQKSICQNSEKICLALNEVESILSDNVIPSLSKCHTSLGSISQLNENYEKVYNVIQESYYNIEEAKRDVVTELGYIDFNSEKQQKIFDRLDYIFNLKRKYGNTIEDVLKYCNNLKKQLENLNSSNEIIQLLSKQLEENTYSLFELSLKMHNIRVKKAKEIEQKVQLQLVELEMPKAKFDIVVEFNNNEFEYVKSSEYSFNQNGLDNIEFLICTNPGSKPQMIGKIASGGELSRLTLALKIVFADSYKIPTIIFDEIDTGLSGQACVSLAKKFKDISNNHQIILITHHANIAAIGTNNIYVKKEMIDEKIISQAFVLNKDEKIEEIARILSGEQKTETAIKHAKELVEQYE